MRKPILDNDKFNKFIQNSIQYLPTRNAFSVGVSILVITFFAPKASADSVAEQIESARSAKAKASNDFYRGMKQLGPNASAFQVDALRSQTLDAAEQKWTSAVIHATTTRAQEIRQQVYDDVKRKFPFSPVPAQILHPELGKGKGNGKSSGSQSSGSKPLPSNVISPGYRDEGPTLDGTNIPKEIQFRGKSKGKKNLSPVPDSTPEVQAIDGGKSKVDVIEYPAASHKINTPPKAAPKPKLKTR